jgi:hypothetical protein
VYVNHTGSGYGNTRITMSNLVTALVGAFGGGALTPGEAASLSNSFENNFLVDFVYTFLYSGVITYLD